MILGELLVVCAGAEGEKSNPLAHEKRFCSTGMAHERMVLRGHVEHEVVGEF